MVHKKKRERRGGNSRLKEAGETAHGPSAALPSPWGGGVHPLFSDRNDSIGRIIIALYGLSDVYVEVIAERVEDLAAELYAEQRSFRLADFASPNTPARRRAGRGARRAGPAAARPEGLAQVLQHRHEAVEPDEGLLAGRNATIVALLGEAGGLVEQPLRPSASNPRSKRRSQREMRPTARLDHPALRARATAQVVGQTGKST